MIKTKKISSGHYQGTYKSIGFKVIKSILPSNEVVWYYQIGNEKVHDFHGSKFEAIQSLISWIEETKS